MERVKLADRAGLIEESVTIALNAKAKSLKTAGRKIYNFTAGELDAETPGYIQKYVAERLKYNKYTPTAGLPELRDLIAKHNRDYYGLDWILSKNVVVTSGAKPAIYAALLSLINPGDEVIVPTPAWVSYIDLIKLAGGVPVTVSLDEDFDLSVESINAVLSDKTKLIIITSPHNPTGTIFSSQKLSKLAELLKDKNIFVLSDDIYNKLVFDDSYTATPKTGFNMIVIINGFSKSQALTGWRIGYMIAPQTIADAATAFLSHINGNAPLMAQFAGIAALLQDDKPPEENTEHLKTNLKIAKTELSKISKLKINNPKGAFYIYLDLRLVTQDSLKWCEELLAEYGVALVPGEAFLTPGFARLTYSGNTETLKKGIKLIEKKIKEDEDA